MTFLSKDVSAAVSPAELLTTRVLVTVLGRALAVFVTVTILVVSGVLVPVRWGGGWRLLVLPCASAALAYVIALSVQIALSIQQVMASLAMLIGASRIVLGVQESPQ